MIATRSVITSYSIHYTKLYDQIENWEVITVPGLNEYKIFSQISVSTDGSITLWNSIVGTLFRSTDEVV